ncbi:hypothetical protein PMO31116_02864 [Pandoraea morbifera]|uniref:Uncharacterized protein n=1 Tax=Pandoraea morbifera TaxID=2508300 RepID=A0A5E4VUU8_9BURK|nr:hypothetical protein [Pandoraea morbifera]VVE16178.1 hypothetical protein PMO31116_02864 [Pandoraea morbifera]
MAAVAGTIETERRARGGRRGLFVVSRATLTLVTVALCAAELRGVGAALYLAQCPHDVPTNAVGWLAIWLDHWRALPVGMSAMAVQCLCHAVWHRREGAWLAGLRTVAMLIPMPLVCEVAAAVMGGGSSWPGTLGYVLSMQIAMLASDAAIGMARADA